MTTSVDLPMDTDLRRIADRLLARLRSLAGVAVGYSGGVDSTLVLAAALRALPANRVLAVIADSPSLARTELVAARQVAADLGAELVEVRVAELDVPGYRANAGDRCYFCKHTVLTAVSELAVQRGIAHVATGTHADDHRAVHRPGLRAARELRVVEPLADAGLGKRKIRLLAAAWSLPVADKPATPCLASRIAVGVPVSTGRLGLVERAEIAVRARLAESGIQPHDLRVRLLGDGYRVELDRSAHTALESLPGLTGEVLTALGGLGLTGAGRVWTYRSPTHAPAIGDSADVP
ncbi:asparagine synthase-related protein [Pseudonocardia asaccharolytica]|uniref:ExsB family transcriptional regulator n=1 Tax=Pseudonocardia asaccharolytica DSM 44247 = NBRC 16224 TaxID=1123024 RepID=A0A511D657_9PSEU|nr:asparagine synthase-related protein [Pseudonocardia asaccharolytica]GEL20270.1 ExsB family transcriptional regulator [Pseudonocardia asaccharolytica DSM 44247 = NBRC 16224]